MNTTTSQDRLTAPLGSCERVETPPTLDVESALAAHPFLKGMDPRQIRMLADCAMLEHFEPGEFLIREGDPANRFYLIIKGKVVLESFAGNKKGRIPIQTLDHSDVLGWSWLFAPYYWQFDAQAAKPTDVVFIYATPLREECENNHDLGYELLKRISRVVVDRLQNTRKQMRDLTW
jgi:CRP-like cAMP-binding protein